MPDPPMARIQTGQSTLVTGMAQFLKIYHIPANGPAAQEGGQTSRMFRCGELIKICVENVPL